MTESSIHRSAETARPRCPGSGQVPTEKTAVGPSIWGRRPYCLQTRPFSSYNGRLHVHVVVEGVEVR